MRHPRRHHEAQSMRTASAKAKGRRLQQEIRDLMLELAPTLEPDDVRSTSMGASGEDLLLSPAARRIYPLSSECKNQERLNIWNALKQAEDHAGEDRAPCVFLTRNRTRTWACVPAESLLYWLSQLATHTQEQSP